MTKNVDLPADYKPYRTLNICGNKLINGRVPFEVNGFVPILVGDGGEGPLVWLQVPANKDLNMWQYVVRANRTLHPAVVVSDNKSEIKVLIKNITVLHAVGVSDTEATILALDLRPLGLTIYGNEHEMVVGGNTMRSNTFENVDAMIGIGLNDPR